MHYGHDARRATELLRKATQFMGQQGIPPNPANFTLWYEYAANENPALGNEIRRLLESGIGIDENLTNRLYESHFGFAKEGIAIETAGTKLTATMDLVGTDLVQASKETAEHCQRLALIFDGGPAVESQENAMRLVQTALAETQEIIVSNKALEAQLADAAQEIETLKQDLAAVRDEAMSDPLTGMVNRKYFDVRLAEQAELAASTGQDLCLIFADIDNFKSFNDTYGHQVGDMVLKLVARAIDESIRGGDTLARYGGEEFCIILPNTGLNGGAAVAENVRNSIASKTLKSSKDGRDFGTVTASFGVADHEPGEATGDLIARADAALYAAKRDGRNQVVLKSHAFETA